MARARPSFALPLKYFEPWIIPPRVYRHRIADTRQSSGLRLHHTVGNLSIPRFLVTLWPSPIHLTASQRKRTSQPRPLFLAGHLALDFLNTRMRVDGKLVDGLQRDQDVLQWLKQTGLAAPRI